MAAHTPFPPAGAEALVRGDPATFVVRFRIGGVDQDITTWTFRSHVRDRFDGSLITECETFDVTTPDDLADLFPTDPGATPCVLLAQWTPEQTKIWQSGFVCDIEELAPSKRTWLIIDSLRVDKDVSYDASVP